MVGVGAPIPALLVNRKMAFATNLPVIESPIAKPGWQWPTQMAFFTPSLSRSARFYRWYVYRVANKGWTAFSSQEAGHACSPFSPL
jgi:hypothetical protein